MPEQISVSDFIEETWDDYNSPTTSSFVSRISQCRNVVTNLEEVRVQCSAVTKSHVKACPFLTSMVLGVLNI